MAERPFYPQLLLPGTEPFWQSLALTPTLVLDGPSGSVSFGFELRSHLDGELLALEARGSRPLQSASEWLRSEMDEAMRIALRHLSPF